MTTYIKTLKVLESCKTREQLITAKNYMNLAKKSLNKYQQFGLIEMFKIKTKEILTQNQ